MSRLESRMNLLLSFASFWSSPAANERRVLLLLAQAKHKLFLAELASAEAHAKVCHAQARVGYLEELAGIDGESPAGHNGAITPGIPAAPPESLYATPPEVRSPSPAGNPAPDSGLFEAIYASVFPDGGPHPSRGVEQVLRNAGAGGTGASDIRGGLVELRDYLDSHQRNLKGTL